MKDGLKKVRKILNKLKEGDKLFLEVEDNDGIFGTEVCGFYLGKTEEKVFTALEKEMINYTPKNAVYKNESSYLIQHILKIKRL